MTGRLLLVDDDPVVLQALSHTLRHSLSTVLVQTFSDATSALQSLQVEPCAVVLTDVTMPGMNGLQFLKAARDHGSDASFIVMTGNATDNMLREGLQFGMFALLQKPFDRLTLIPLVQQAMECYRLRQEVTALRCTVVESGLELGHLLRDVVGEPDDMAQPTLPY